MDPINNPISISDRIQQLVNEQQGEPAAVGSLLDRIASLRSVVNQTPSVETVDTMGVNLGAVERLTSVSEGTVALTANQSMQILDGKLVWKKGVVAALNELLKGPVIILAGEAPPEELEVVPDVVIGGADDEIILRCSSEDSQFAT